MFIWFILAGLISGVFAGMGMGGGTFLLPILTLILSVGQQQAQLVNLIVFALTSIPVLIIQWKNKLLNFHDFWIIAVPACLVSFIGAMFALSINSKILKYIFAGFICFVGVLQIVLLIVEKIKNKQG